jgi:hypothetical protein
MSVQNRQNGGSAIGLIIALVIIAYGVYVGIQYIPQYIESTAVNRILDNVADTNRKEPFTDATVVRDAIEKELFINEMKGLMDSFDITASGGGYTIKVRYERKLDLLFVEKTMPYEKTVTLE